MKKVLMVAEKPMLAASISDILSNGKKVTKKGMKIKTTTLSIIFLFIDTILHTISIKK